MMKEFIRSIVVFFITVEARAALRKYHPKVMVVTGSVGKTTTKDAAYTALSRHAFVRKSEKSFNSDIGVPLTILGIPNGWGNPVIWFRNLIEGLLVLVVTTRYPSWLIVEVGADRPGDISKSLSWLAPDAVIATRIPEVPVHVEYYPSPEEVFVEESGILSRLAAGGVAVLSADDPRLATYALPSGVRRITYGFAMDADVRASGVRPLVHNGLPTGVRFDLSYRDLRVSVALPGALGENHVAAIAAGVAAGIAAGTSLKDAAANFSSYATPPGRMRLISGVEGSMIIDDSYNASPAATEDALSALKKSPARGKRIAILADMLELGRYSAEAHERVGRIAAASADIVLATGVRARGIEEGAIAAGKAAESVRWFERAPDAASYALSAIGDGDLVLVKGSQSMRMERVVKALMQEPARARDLLCRQDDEWLAR